MSTENETPRCVICGEPMPEGETMFKYHGYSGPCPAPPLPKSKAPILIDGVPYRKVTFLVNRRLGDHPGRPARVITCVDYDRDVGQYQYGGEFVTLLARIEDYPEPGDDP